MEHHPDELEKSYTMDFDSQHKICARYYGNYSRFINHSCKPNCFVILKELYGSKVYIIYANTSISPGEELTINYGKNHLSVYALIAQRHIALNALVYLNL